LILTKHNNTDEKHESGQNKKNRAERNKTELKEEDKPLKIPNLASYFLFLVVSTGPLDFFQQKMSNIFQYSSSASFSI